MASRKEKPRLVLFSAKGENSFLAQDRKRLLALADVNFIKAAAPLPRKIFLQKAAKAHFLAITPRSFPGITTKEIGLLSNLMAVSVPTTGTEWLNTAPFLKCKIPVINTPDFSTQACAEFTWALILDSMRYVSEAKRQAALYGKRQWGLLGSELNGKTLGVVGYGNIGKRVAAIAQVFGMKVLVFDTHKDQYDSVVESAPSLKALVQSSHIVTLHLPLTPKTYGMFNQRLITSLRPNTLLINTARPDLVNLGAIKKALSLNLLSQYVFDAGYWPAQKVKTAAKIPGVNVVPHISWYTEQAIANEMRCWTDRLVETIQQIW